MLNPEKYPSEIVRQKLVGLGIPYVKHNLGTLMALLPVSLEQKQLQELDADAVAEVVIYLESKNLIQIPWCSEKQVPFGAHICQLYGSPQELMDLVLPYFKKGLENGEYCIWIVSSITVAEAWDRLEKAMPRFDAYRAQIEVRQYEDWYLDADGKLQALETILASWTERERTAIQAGFSGLRISGDTYRIPPSDWSNFMTYECAAHSLLPQSKIKAICTYPVQHSEVIASLGQILASHESLVAQQHGDWHWMRTADSQTWEALIAELRP